jgi:hypothetical protein
MLVIANPSTMPNSQIFSQIPGAAIGSTYVVRGNPEELMPDIEVAATALHLGSNVVIFATKGDKAQMQEFQKKLAEQPFITAPPKLVENAAKRRVR